MDSLWRSYQKILITQTWLPLTSKLKQVWEDSDLFLEKLKFLNLSHSHYLPQSPDFSKLPNLEQLILQDCRCLLYVDQSIGEREKLVSVDLKDCKVLRDLPESFYKLTSVQALDLAGCSQFENLAEDLGEMASLTTLMANNTVMKSIPLSIFRLKNLNSLSLDGLKLPLSTNHLPPSLSGLNTLRELSLAGCNLTDDEIPKELVSLYFLEHLDLHWNSFCSLPSLSGILKLETLRLNKCTNLLEIPDLPTNLEILEADDCIALEKMPDFSDMSRMRELHLNHSAKLTEIIGLDKALNSMTILHMEGCTNLTAAFKESIQRGWSASGNGGLFLPGPSWLRGVQPKEEINEYTLDCESRSYSSEYKEGRNHEAARPGDDSYDENRSHKRIRFDLSIESNAEGTVAGEYNCIVVQNHKSCMESDATFEEGGDGEDEEKAPSAVLVSVNCSSSGTDQKYKFGIS